MMTYSKNSKKQKENKLKKAIALGLMAGVMGSCFVLPMGAEAGDVRNTRLSTHYNMHWQGHGDRGFNDTLLLYRRYWTDPFWTHWLESNGDAAWGYMDWNRVAEVIRDPGLQNYINIAYDGFSELTSTGFHNGNKNGTYTSGLSFTEVRSNSSFYVGNGGYVLSPLVFLDAGSNTYVEKGGYMTVMMPRAEELVKIHPIFMTLIKAGVWVVGGVLYRIVENPAWYDARVTVDGGNLILTGMPSQYRGAGIYMHEGNVFNVANLGLNFKDDYLTGLAIKNSGVDYVTGGTVYNSFSQLHLLGTSAFGDLEIKDIGLFNNKINSGITYIGSEISEPKYQTPMNYDWKNKTLNQAFIYVMNPNSTFTSSAPDKIKASFGLSNDGTLNFIGSYGDGKAVPTMTNNISYYSDTYAKAELNLSGNINKGKAAITVDTASQLELVLGIEASFWNNYEKVYRETLHRLAEIKRLDSIKSWASNFPLKKLVEYGWIKAVGNDAERILAFFGVASPDAYDDVWSDVNKAFAYRKSGKMSVDIYALACWLRQGERMLEGRKLPAYNVKKLKEALPVLREMSSRNIKKLQSEGVKLLADCGIHLIFIKELPNMPVHGVTRTLKDGSVLIQLSLRYKTDAQLWFSLFHELGHVFLHRKYDFASSAKTAQQKMTLEKEADAFATNTFISKEDYETFSKTRPTTANIKKFAEKLRIAPGIVVGRWQYENNCFTKFNHLKVKLQWE